MTPSICVELRLRTWFDLRILSQLSAKNLFANLLEDVSPHRSEISAYFKQFSLIDVCSKNSPQTDFN